MRARSVNQGMGDASAGGGERVIRRCESGVKVGKGGRRAEGLSKLGSNQRAAAGVTLPLRAHNTTVIVVSQIPDICDTEDMDLVLPQTGDVIPAVQQEEWTTSKRVVNHKTRQTETRVQRHIVMEDGKVIADSGPQVSSRTKEDATTEESEDSKKGLPPATHRPPAVLPSGHIRVPGTHTVLNESTSTRSKTKSSRVENAQYHDEALKELTGFEVHKKAISAPNELISLSDHVAGSAPAGTLVHFSVNGQKVRDVEETKSCTRKDFATGESRTETTKTYHQEVHDEDEAPNGSDYDAIPENYTDTNQNLSYYQNFSDDDEEDGLSRKQLQRKALSHVLRVHESGGRGDSPDPGEYRFTRYQIKDRDTSSSSSSASSVIQAGGNVIKIELAGSRSPSVLSGSSSYNHHRERSRRLTASPPVPEPDYDAQPASTKTNSRSTPPNTFYFGAENNSNSHSHKNRNHNNNNTFHRH